jgi:superfamily II DNA helicase RecQ
MTRKKSPFPYRLTDPKIPSLPPEELKIILRGADPLIMSGGRTLLTKVLKGSRDKRVIEHKLDKCPVYGSYGNLSEKDILTKIDWVIRNGYLYIEYNGRLPVLVYSEKGWEIEKETYSDELLHGMIKIIESSAEIPDMTYLKDRDRPMILLLLDKIVARGDKRLIPLLEAWEKVDYRKVRERIREVIKNINKVKLIGKI